MTKFLEPYATFETKEVEEDGIAYAMKELGIIYNTAIVNTERADCMKRKTWMISALMYAMVFMACFGGIARFKDFNGAFRACIG